MAVAIRWSKLSPAPPVSEIELGESEFQHDTVREFSKYRFSFRLVE